jgi:hypothetical protein
MGEAKAAFLALKLALVTAPLLQLPDFTKRFVVDYDASGAGFGAVLHQGDGTIAFFSRLVTPHHAKLPSYEHELIGLVKAIRHWWPYLWGRAFTIQTDHWSLKFLLGQDNAAAQDLHHQLAAGTAPEGCSSSMACCSTMAVSSFRRAPASRGSCSVTPMRPAMKGHKRLSTAGFVLQQPRPPPCPRLRASVRHLSTQQDGTSPPSQPSPALAYAEPCLE